MKSNLYEYVIKDINGQKHALKIIIKQAGNGGNII